MSLGKFHGYKDSIRWRITPDGVEIEGSGPERTTVKPEIAGRAWELFAEDVNRVAASYDLPCALLVAAVCTESAAGDPRAVYTTPGYVSDEKTPDKVCLGLMQTLLSTARDVLEEDVDREWLLEPSNSISAGAAYIRDRARDTRFDPPLVAAAYAAGSLRYDRNPNNRWRLEQGRMKACFMAGGYCDRFVRFFNDAVEVLASAKTSPSVGIDALLNGRS